MTTAAAVKPATTSSLSHSFRYAPIQSSIGVWDASARSGDMRHGQVSEGANHVQQRTVEVIVYAAVEFVPAYRQVVIHVAIADTDAEVAGEAVIDSDVEIHERSVVVPVVQREIIEAPGNKPPRRESICAIHAYGRKGGERIGRLRSDTRRAERDLEIRCVQAQRNAELALVVLDERIATGDPENVGVEVPAHRCSYRIDIVTPVDGPADRARAAAPQGQILGFDLPAIAQSHAA